MSFLAFDVLSRRRIEFPQRKKFHSFVLLQQHNLVDKDRITKNKVGAANDEFYSPREAVEEVLLLLAIHKKVQRPIAPFLSEIHLHRDVEPFSVIIILPNMVT